MQVRLRNLKRLQASVPLWIALRKMAEAKGKKPSSPMLRFELQQTPKGIASHMQLSIDYTKWLTILWMWRCSLNIHSCSWAIFRSDGQSHKTIETFLQGGRMRRQNSRLIWSVLVCSTADRNCKMLHICTQGLIIHMEAQTLMRATARFITQLSTPTCSNFWWITFISQD